jgi:hypothetical protein
MINEILTTSIKHVPHKLVVPPAKILRVVKTTFTEYAHNVQ